MRLFFMLIIVLFAALYIVPSYSETTTALPKSLSGIFDDSEISLMFSDGRVSGTLTIDNNTNSSITLDDLKVIERHDRFYIFDKQNNLKIFSKQISDEKYIILVKLGSDTKLRFITNSDNQNKNTGQRNLFDAMNEKQAQLDAESKSSKISFKEQQLQEKEKKLEDALKKHKDIQKKISEQEKDVSDTKKTKEKILEDYEKSKITTGMDLVTKDTNTKEEKKKITDTANTVSKDKKIKSFISAPHNVEWKKELRYDVLVTDDSGHRYNPDYKSYVGNELEDAVVSGKIINSLKKIIHKFNGTTNSNGIYFDKFLIPDNSDTSGKYTITVDAVITFKDKTIAKSNTSKTFFVFSN